MAHKKQIQIENRKKGGHPLYFQSETLLILSPLKKRVMNAHDPGFLQGAGI